VRLKMLPCTSSKSSQETKCRMCMQLAAEMPRSAAVVERLVAKFLGVSGAVLFVDLIPLVP
jgi:hypothetical protein